MIEFILYGAVSFFVLLVFFANIMLLERWVSSKPKWVYWSLFPLAVVFYILDVLWNVVFGTVFFMQVPSKDRLTLTERMKHILLTRDDWRFKLAYFICRRLVEPWDPNHCGLSEL